MLSVDVETIDEGADEPRPVALWLGGSRIEILDVEDRWYSAGYSYCRVFAADAATYMLRRDRINGSWTVVYRSA
jgi:hypothetical protein